MTVTVWGSSTSTHFNLNINCNNCTGQPIFTTHKHGHTTTIIRQVKFGQNFLIAKEGQQFQISVTPEHLKNMCYSSTSQDVAAVTISMVWMVRSQFPAETGCPFLDTNFQTSSGIHSDSYVMEKWDSFPKRQSSRKMTMHIHFYTMPRFNSIWWYASNPIHLLGMVLKTQGPLYLSHVMYTCLCQLCLQ